MSSGMHCFFQIFQSGELLPEPEAYWLATTDLAWGDVAIDSLTKPTMVQVHLKRSKVDQNGQGADMVVGCTGTSVCAGMEDSMIQTLGKWHSAAFLNYIRTPTSRLVSTSAILMRRQADGRGHGHVQCIQ